MKLDPDVKDRVMALVAQEPSPSRPAIRRLERLGFAVALGLATWTGLVLSVACNVAASVHVVFGHVLPVFAAAFVGLSLGGVLDPSRQGSMGASPKHRL